MDKLNKIKEYIEKRFKFSQNSDFKSLYNSGIDAYDKKDYEKAISQFKLAIEQENIKPQVYYNLALTYQSMKEYDNAILTYNKFLELNPKDYDGLYNIALTYFNKENYQKAIEFFEKCIEIKKDEDVIKAIVLSYLNNNQMQKALDFAQKIFETTKNGIDLYYMIAKVFENRNTFNKDFTYIDKAIEMYKKIVEKDSKYFDAYLSISICYARKGEWINSVDFCNKALGVNPKSYEANNQMGLVFYCCNEIKDAIKYYETAMKFKPAGEYKIYSNLGYAYEKSGKYEKAIKTFTELVSKFPNCPIKDEIKNHLRILKSL